MSSRTVVTVQGLGKRYRIGELAMYRSLSEAIPAMGRRLFRRPQQSTRPSTATSEFWALRDVSFDVKEGEVLGIIGHNGAGKSTLLKILSRITEPTVGHARMRGRLSSLLEVGTGFHPELTGRENVFLNGTILGMTRREITRKFDEIVEFSGVEKFLDTPVKRYSSGMSVRLAFAVAAHLEPEVLIIDEVLAVGDAEFQSKCLGKMEDVAKSGRTVLFVSHNMAAVESLCTQAMLLSRGALVALGDVPDVIEQYMSKADLSATDVDLRDHPDRVPGSTPILQRLRITNDVGDVLPAVRTGDDSTFEITVQSRTMLPMLKVMVVVYGPRGERLLTMGNHIQEGVTWELDGGMVVKARMRNCRLAQGRYTIGLIAKSGWTKIDEIPSGLAFDVVPTGFETATGTQLDARFGCVIPEVDWSMTIVE